MTIVLALACSGLLLGELPPAATDPRAAGLMGLMYDQGRWVSPDEVAGRDLGDARLAGLRAEYAARRDRARGTAESQRTLAAWCDRVGLEAEAEAHFTAVTRLDPDDPDARRRLGYRIHRGTWMTDSEIAAESAESEAQARADRSWGPRIATYRRWMTEPEHRPEAVEALTAIRDPRAVPSLRRAFGDRVAWEQSWAIKLLGPIDSPRSSQILAQLAVFGLDDPVRLAAIDRLVGRDQRTFVGLLINWLRDPIRYRMTTAGGGAVLRVEGRDAIIDRFYRPATSSGAATRMASNLLDLDNLGRPAPRRGGSSYRLGSDGRPERVGRETTTPIGEGEAGARRAAEGRRLDDARALDRANVTVELTNARVVRTLARVTGVDLGSDPEAWAGWWTSELGYSYESPKPVPKPVVAQEVEIRYVAPKPAEKVVAVPTFSYVRHSCFGAGTPVLSRSGERPIEDLRVGDQVLTQDTDTGDLSFRPIVAVFHNKPTMTLRVDLEGESILATPIHQFWSAGQGWTTARDLRPGDRVRILGGTARVIAVERDKVRPVFNLEVAGGHSFFAGHRRALVHDNSLVGPTPTPFDAPRIVAEVRGR